MGSNPVGRTRGEGPEPERSGLSRIFGRPLPGVKEGGKRCKRWSTSATAAIWQKRRTSTNKYLARINKLLEDGWTVAQMNTQTVDVDPRLDGCLHKEMLVSFVILEKNQ